MPGGVCAATDLGMQPRVGWPYRLQTPVLHSEALLAHDVYVCLERPSGALPPELTPCGGVGAGFHAAEQRVADQVSGGQGESPSTLH